MSQCPSVIVVVDTVGALGRRPVIILICVYYSFSKFPQGWINVTIPLEQGLEGFATRRQKPILCASLTTSLHLREAGQGVLDSVGLAIWITNVFAFVGFGRELYL